MKATIIVRTKEINSFKDACDFFNVRIDSELPPQTDGKKEYDGKEFTLEIDSIETAYLIGKHVIKHPSNEEA